MHGYTKTMIALYQLHHTTFPVILQMTLLHYHLILQTWLTRSTTKINDYRQIPTHTHTHTHTHSLTHTHVHAHMRAHTHTHTLTFSSDITWKSELSPIEVQQFFRLTGPKVPIQASILGTFQLLFTTSLMEYIVQQTNLYANQCMGDEQYSTWEVVTVDELGAYFGFMIYMRLVHLLLNSQRKPFSKKSRVLSSDYYSWMISLSALF